ncbi:MAG: caspase family protein, partial [Magnetococcus sp. YQC-5]
LTSIQVADLDSANLTVTLTLSTASAGSFSTATSGAVTSSFDGTLWRASGAKADINTLLAGLMFTPAANWDQNFTIATSVSDGMAPAVTGTKSVIVTQVNDAPTATNLNADEGFMQNAASFHLARIVITDVDSSHVTATLALSTASAGSLSTTRSGSVISTFDGTVWQASGAWSDVNTLLAEVTFTPSRNWSQNFFITSAVNDGLITVTGIKNVMVTAEPTVPKDKIKPPAVNNTPTSPVPQVTLPEIVVSAPNVSPTLPGITKLPEVVPVVPVVPVVSPSNVTVQRPDGLSVPTTDPVPSTAEVIKNYQNSSDPVGKVIGGVLEKVAQGQNVQQADLIKTLEKNGANHDTVMAALHSFVQVQKEARTELYSGALQELDQHEAVNVFDAEMARSKGEIPNWFPALTGEKIAILIGVNRYEQPIPSLNTPINDVTEIAEILRARGYQTIILPDASYRTVMDAFRVVGETISEKQDLLVYYAGHGYLKEDTNIGYWLLSDAQVGSANKWISTRHLADFLQRVKSRHTMVVSDSCFSGALTREYTFTSESVGLSQKEVAAKRSVMMMSSGGEEPVMDGGGDGHSVFASRLIQMLKGLESGKSGFDLFHKVRSAVVQRSPQTPQYGGMLSAGHEPGGEYFF